MKMKISLLIFIFLNSLFAQPTEKDEYWYYDEAEIAISKENYEHAISILNEGLILFPDSYDIAEKIGDLYFDKELYSMALDSYHVAEKIDEERGSIIFNIASTLGRLNENDDSILYYERLLDYEDFRTIAIDDLSWLYYKVHRLEESESMLLDEIELEFHRSLAITLGTVYSGMYQYDKSKKYYLLSIEDAFENNANYFASVALYNLSLLEFSFYNYEESMEYTEQSLDSEDRSSGHLARGEVLQLAGRYREAEDEYSTAESIDETPLSRISLARLYQKGGHLEKAYSYMNDVINRRDMSWLYYFGTDRDQYTMDLSSLFSDIFKAMAEKEKQVLYGNPFLWTKGKFREIKYRILSYYHSSIYRKKARLIGDDNKGESDLNSWWAYSRASMGNKATFMKYIELCEEFELELTNKAVPWYLLEKGRETHNYSMLEEALSLFRTDWEQEPIMDTLVYLIKFGKKRNKNLNRNRLNALFELNRGALVQNDLFLPLKLEHSGLGSERTLKRYVRRSGSEVIKKGEEGFHYKLIVTIEEETYKWYLLDPLGEISAEYSATYEKLNQRTYREIVQSVNDRIYLYPF